MLEHQTKPRAHKHYPSQNGSHPTNTPHHPISQQKPQTDPSSTCAHEQHPGNITLPSAIPSASRTPISHTRCFVQPTNQPTSRPRMPAQDLHPYPFHSTAKRIAGRGGTGALERLRSCVSEHPRAGIYIESIRIYGCPARDPDDVAVGN
ncbi:hypothetical protein B9Z19DRAFT_1086366 [Tuber borchii]|uniref:Uncharacterized protein n=1 Tax=Tuber borchii TaxID=42251 RepID=A0A2T6ZPI0_TUBBO|nr:hypothetical protein B9Z19DRAFT_1086366 [Tuber borchii]